MSVLERPSDCKPHVRSARGKLPDDFPDAAADNPDRPEIVSRLRAPTKAAFFEALRLRTDNRTWRFSPDVPGLGLIKRIVIGTYRIRMISGLSAQRVIDRLKLWEA